MRRPPGIRLRSSSSCSPRSFRPCAAAACHGLCSGRWRSSAPSPSGASSRSRGPTRRATPGTEPTGRCSSSPSTRCSRLFPGGRRRLRRCCSACSRPGRRQSAAGSSSRRPSPASAKAASPIPSGYANANAALFLAAFWPAAVLASRRETPWPARGLLLAVAGLLLQLGSARPEPWLAACLRARARRSTSSLVPDRARSLLTLLPIGAATALSLRPTARGVPRRPGRGSSRLWLPRGRRSSSRLCSLLP